jgi:hypothetical protein
VAARIFAPIFRQHLTGLVFGVGGIVSLVCIVSWITSGPTTTTDRSRESVPVTASDKLAASGTVDTGASTIEKACQDLDRAEFRSLDEFTAKTKVVEDEALKWPEFIPYRDKVLANGGTPLKHSAFQRKRYEHLLPIMIEYRDHEISVWKTNEAAVRGCSGAALDKLRQEGLEGIQGMTDTIDGYQKEL